MSALGLQAPAPAPGWPRSRFLVISLVVLLADQLTKLWAVNNLAGRGPQEVIPNFLNFVFSKNPGGLFGAFRDLPDIWRLLLLTVLPSVAVLMIAWFLITGLDIDRRTLIGLSLILGGAVGNLLDRAFRGAVVDFLDVYAASPKLAGWLIDRFGTAHWPTFNVADSAIVSGALLLMLSIVRPEAETAQASAKLAD